MNLEEFIEKFVQHNTLIRLQYDLKDTGYHEQVDDGKPEMEWKLKKGKFRDREVIGITDILYGTYQEAVNIVIERPEDHRDRKLNSVLTPSKIEKDEIEINRYIV